MRIAATAVVGFSSLRFGDAGPYLFAASEIAQHGRYPDRTEAYFFRPPAYPLLLAAVTGGRPDRIPAAKVANALLGAAAVSLQVVWRYRAPYWDPVLLLYGTFGAARR